MNLEIGQLTLALALAASLVTLLLLGGWALNRWLWREEIQALAFARAHRSLPPRFELHTSETTGIGTEGEGERGERVPRAA
jgi:hypothetical protein